MMRVGSSSDAQTRRPARPSPAPGTVTVLLRHALLPRCLDRRCTTSRSTSRSARATSSPTSRQSRPPARARSRAGCCARTRALRGQGRQHARHATFPMPVTRALLDRGPAALRHLLRALPRPDGQRQRHGRPARLPAAAVLPHRPAARRAGRPLLRRDDERLRRDARLRRADRVEDRWAIVAYVRALQLSQEAPVADVPPDATGELDRPAPRRVRPTSPAFPTLYHSAAACAGTRRQRAGQGRQAVRDERGRRRAARTASAVRASSRDAVGAPAPAGARRRDRSASPPAPPGVSRAGRTSSARISSPACSAWASRSAAWRCSCSTT